MTEALAALLGALIGGSMVVVGDVLARPADDRRRWLERLHDAAAELVHYEWHREVAISNSRRQVGALGLELEAAFGQQRRRAAAKLWTLPDAADVRTDMRELMSKTNSLTDMAEAAPETYEAARSEYFEALRSFQDTVQQHLDHL